jgi:hypothetical protein
MQNLSKLCVIVFASLSHSIDFSKNVIMSQWWTITKYVNSFLSHHQRLPMSRPSVARGEPRDGIRTSRARPNTISRPLYLSGWSRGATSGPQDHNVLADNIWRIEDIFSLEFNPSRQAPIWIAAPHPIPIIIRKSNFDKKLAYLRGTFGDIVDEQESWDAACDPEDLWDRPRSGFVISP